MFVNFNVSEYLLSVKAKRSMRCSITTLIKSRCAIVFFNFTYMQQTSVQSSWFGTA